MLRDGESTPPPWYRRYAACLSVSLDLVPSENTRMVCGSTAPLPPWSLPTMSLLRLASTFQPWSTAYCAMILPPYKPCSSPESAEYTSVAGNLYFDNTRAVSISAATPAASSLAPGESPVASITSLRRESRCAVITITRFGSDVPRWIATTSITSAPALGMRSPVNTWEGFTISRQPLQPFEISWNCAATQRRAAPMPRVFEVVVESVWRVPNPTSAVSVARRLEAFTAPTIACSSGWVFTGGGAAKAATLTRAPAITADSVRVRSMMFPSESNRASVNPAPRDCTWQRSVCPCTEYLPRAPRGDAAIPGKKVRPGPERHAFRHLVMAFQDQQDAVGVRAAPCKRLVARNPGHRLPQATGVTQQTIVRFDGRDRHAIAEGPLHERGLGFDVE